MNDTAPIALFVYDRPEHARATVEALAGNPLATGSDLFVFSDGPRTRESSGAVARVREYLRAIQGFRSVQLVERERNLGLAGSILDGVTRVCEEKGRAIVVEDDVVVSRYFLEYMNAALARYEREDRVMQVSGYMYPVRELDRLPETFFLRTTSSWGWATWRRAWRQFNPDATFLAREIARQGRRRDFDILGTAANTIMLSDQARGWIDSWAICWYASVFLKGGLCLFPRDSLVRNIGTDGSGVHCGRTDVYDVNLASRCVSGFPVEIRESPEALRAVAAFHRSIRSSLPDRLACAVLRKLGVWGWWRERRRMSRKRVPSS